MFKIKKEYDKHETKSFRIPSELSDKLTELAEKHNTSVNKIVIQCLEYALNDLEEDEPEEKTTRKKK